MYKFSYCRIFMNCIKFSLIQKSKYVNPKQSNYSCLCFDLKISVKHDSEL